MKKYGNLDGLRSISAGCIVMMHVYVVGGYNAGGVLDLVFNQVVSSFGLFVRLFFIISGFSMCCGYYEKMKNNQMSLEQFYHRRYKKIFPFLPPLLYWNCLQA